MKVQRPSVRATTYATLLNTIERHTWGFTAAKVHVVVFDQLLTFWARILLDSMILARSALLATALTRHTKWDMQK